MDMQTLRWEELRERKFDAERHWLASGGVLPAVSELENSAVAIARLYAPRVLDVVYILDESEDASPVKIITSGIRLSALRFGNPRNLRVLYAEPGSMAIEHFIHTTFGDARMAGDWFARTAAVQRFIDISCSSGIRRALYDAHGIAVYWL